MEKDKTETLYECLQNEYETQTQARVTNNNNNNKYVPLRVELILYDRGIFTIFQ